jgi:hypothetical protein
LRGESLLRQGAGRRSCGLIRRAPIETGRRVFVTYQRHVGNDAVGPAVQADQQVNETPAKAAREQQADDGANG